MTGSGLAANSAVGTYSVNMNFSAVTVKGYSTTSPDGYTIGALGSSTVSLRVIPATLTVTGTSVTSKVFDNTAAATLTGGTLSGSILAADASNVSLGGSGVGSFASVNVGTGIRVTASGFSLTGSAAGNYTLIQPTGLSGTITPLALTLTTATSFDKAYDTTTSAAAPVITLTTSLPAGQSITFSGSASYASPNVVCSATCNGSNATTQTVNISGIKAVAASGTLLSNYSFSTSGLTSTGTITPATIRATSVTVPTKTYGQAASIPVINYTGLLGNDTTSFTTALTVNTVAGLSNGLSVTDGPTLGAGTYNIAVTGQSNTNYKLETFPPTTGSLTVNKATITVAGIASTTHSYGDAAISSAD